MKKILLAFFVSLFLGFGAKAQTTMVTNNFSCDIEVWQLCYDLNCNFISETLYDVSGGGGTVNIPDCGAGLVTQFFVRYTNLATLCSGGMEFGYTCNSPANGTQIVGINGINCTCGNSFTVDFVMGQLDIYP